MTSESFERAAYQLSRSLDNFGHGDFDSSCRSFETSVNKLARILGMQAENDNRKHRGESIAYLETDFLNA
jgi:hypothetical protein